jgi:hypothetical protein
MSSMAGGNANFAPGCHIWFGGLKFIITGEGDDLDLVPPTDKPTSFPEPMVNL